MFGSGFAAKCENRANKRIKQLRAINFSCLFQIRRCFRANTLALERLVPPLDLAIFTEA